MRGAAHVVEERREDHSLAFAACELVEARGDGAAEFASARDARLSVREAEHQMCDGAHGRDVAGAREQH